MEEAFVRNKLATLNRAAHDFSEPSRHASQSAFGPIPAPPAGGAAHEATTTSRRHGSKARKIEPPALLAGEGLTNSKEDKRGPPFCGLRRDLPCRRAGVGAT